MQRLMAHDFPGNIRELENLMERGVIFCRTQTLTSADLSLPADSDPFFQNMKSDLLNLDFKEAKEQAIELFHQAYLREILNRSGGNISRAADLAKIQRQYLHRLIKDAGIDASRFRTNGSWKPEDDDMEND